MQILKFTVIGFLALLPGFASTQCKTISEWAAPKKGITSLCFYPTTLRMINISKDESFNKMVKDIDKLRIFISDNTKNHFKKEDITALRSGIKGEDYKDMMRFSRGKELIYIFVKEKHEKPVGFAGIIFTENNLMLIDLEGYLSPEVINQLATGKMNLEVISQIYDLTKPDKNKKK